MKLMAKSISRDTPLAEVTLRKYGKPQGLKGRELLKKLCLSLGLLQPGDSRDVVVDVLQVMLESRKELASPDIENLTIRNREKHGLPPLGVAPSNIRRQLLRLRDLFIVEKVGNSYRINENAKLSELFREKLEKYYLESILSRVREYVDETDREFLERKEE
jgi:DNA-binding transcriptional ArsR family regulator